MGGCGISDVVMMFVRVEEIIRGECVSHQRCGVDRVFCFCSHLL